MRFYVKGVGLIAPGLESWQQGRGVLTGERDYQPQALMPFKPSLLPPNERRRTTALIKLALQTAEDALQGYVGKASELASVFASAEGDAEVADKICRALLLPDQPVSPTLFHNSVHNAPAGYWAIASGSRRFSTSIAAGEESFALGLMEAATVVSQEQQDVLLIAYDYPLPPPLLDRGLVSVPFGMALICSAQPGATARMQIQLSMTEQVSSPPTLPEPLEALRTGNPAAASLPLLALLAADSGGGGSLPCSAAGTLCVELTSC